MGWGWSGVGWGGVGWGQAADWKPVPRELGRETAAAAAAVAALILLKRPLPRRGRGRARERGWGQSQHNVTGVRRYRSSHTILRTCNRL